ncbi:hypothetical protein [Streptomyces sp. NBC_01465]|uniref:hypothetical protein n=1 Tax=Streptomyces sp. NBC_01465 TaxID=2903878 RepID=UPI002E3135BB|nr:hypothetical protein [Streptomyces sp. NBC_01465]
MAAFVTAYESGDVPSLVTLLSENVLITMPPLPLEYRGTRDAERFLSVACPHPAGRTVRLVPVRANGQPAFGLYVRDTRTPLLKAYGLLVLTLSGDRISALTRFTDNSTHPHHGLPRTLPES